MTFTTSRTIPASAAQVFAAFENSSRLAVWWGPDGFTNTFHACEFKPGGTWSFVMHGPDGKNYPNESMFREIDPEQMIVIDHVSQPRFVLTVSFEPTDEGETLVRWEQVFEDPEFAKGVEPIVVPANEQNLNRLTAEVMRGIGGG